jgi:Winged helix DNA-binding domain
VALLGELDAVCADPPPETFQDGERRCGRLRGVRTLTRRELNRALLARQLLLERSDLPLPRALEQVAGIQAQYAPSMYIGLWSRLTGFDRQTLTDALVARTVVQATLMRMTIHLVSREDFWPFALAVREPRRAQWLRTRPEPISARSIGATARKVARELSGGGEIRRADLDALVGKDRSLGAGLWVDLVRAPPSGTWERRRADLFALAEDWIGPPGVDARAAADHLVRRYLRGFGPASRKDVASFTGIALTPLARILGRLELRRFATEDGEELLDVPDGPLPDPGTPAPPRFLGTWDATLLTHARRTGVLPEEHRPKIFHVKAPHSFPTFLVDGAVAGTWRFEDGEVALSPFAPLASHDEAVLREEAARLAAFHA